MTIAVHFPPDAAQIDPVAAKRPSIFLAGTIDMGASIDWQGHVIASLQIAGVADTDIFNPRRANWDTSWEQTIDNQQFRGQVDWELDHLEMADILAFHFEPGSMSPISLMELGLASGWQEYRGRDIFVSCPEGFWRRGNVEILVDRTLGAQMVDSLDGLLHAIQTRLAAGY